MAINLKGKHWLTLGLKGSGKSNFNKWLLSQRPNHFVFDPVKEFNGYHRYMPENTRGDEAIKELKAVTQQVVKPNRQSLDYFYVDEVNRFVSKRGQLDGPVGELVDLNRHYDMGVGFTARLPQQVHVDIRELADYIFIFNLAGKASKQFLDDMSDGALRAMESLEEHECVMLDPQRNVKVLSPAPNMDGKTPNLSGGAIK